VYMMACAPYSADTDELQNTLKTVYDIYKNFKQYPEALRIA